MTRIFFTLPFWAALAFTTLPSFVTAQSTCATKGRPSGKVLQGYWESWDNSAVHPGFGYTPVNNTVLRQSGYNVYAAAFPIIQPDGTALWQTGMDSGTIVPTPEQMCAAKAAGATILLSIGGQNGAIDLTSSAVADQFIATIVPILKQNNFDGIDIDIETGLVNSGNINVLSTQQTNLIRIIDGVLAAMPSNFGLTMAPETAYVTGGVIAYGNIWGAYLPIIKKYVDNGRLWWLNMQYYNGEMYDCSGNSYPAGSTAGFVAQTQCLNAGVVVQGVTVQVPFDKQVPGLPAQVGAGAGYLTTAQVTSVWSQLGGQLKGMMTWSMNWDGSKGWTFGNNLKGPLGTA